MSIETVASEQPFNIDDIGAQIDALGEQIRVEDRYPVTLFQGILRYGDDSSEHWDRRITVRCGENTAESLVTTGVPRSDPSREGFAVQISDNDTTHNHEATAAWVRTNKGDKSLSRLGQKWLIQSSKLGIVWYGDSPQGHSRFELSLEPLNSSPEVFHTGTLTQLSTNPGGDNGRLQSSGNLRHCERMAITPQLERARERRQLVSIIAQHHAEISSKAAAIAVGETLSPHFF